MRWIACASLLSLIVGCGGTSAETCSYLDVCLDGTYQLCVADGRCSIVASDGSSLACASCSDCTGAFAQAQLQCRARGGGGGGGGPDMIVLPVVVDMAPSLLTCQQILSCSKTCVAKPDIVGCETACAARGSPSAQQQFPALLECVYSFCVLDASAQSIAICTSNALGSPNQCMAQASNCQ